MKTTVNGSEREVPQDATLAELLASLALEPRGVAVAVNEAVIARSRYTEITLCDGDRIEVIHAVAGG